MEWQPIETAPKDGRVVLSYWDDMPVFIAWIDDMPPRRTTKRKTVGWGPFKREVDDGDEVEEREAGWRVLLTSRGGQMMIHGNYAPFTPPGWVPLPDPPDAVSRETEPEHGP